MVTFVNKREYVVIGCIIIISFTTMLKFSHLIDAFVIKTSDQLAMIVPLAFATTDFVIPDWTKPDETANNEHEKEEWTLPS